MITRSRMMVVAFSLGLSCIAACTGGLRRELVSLRARVGDQSRALGALRGQLERVEREGGACRTRLDRLSEELAQARARIASVTGTSTRGGGSTLGAAARADSSTPGHRTAPAAQCPSDLPAAVRKVRKGMKAEEVRRRLSGVPLEETETVTLTGAGERRTKRLAGPCFVLRFEGDRVVEVERLGGEAESRPRVRPRHRRR